jgi:hypothetical protein
MGKSMQQQQTDRAHNILGCVQPVSKQCCSSKIMHRKRRRRKLEFTHMVQSTENCTYALIVSVAACTLSDS